MICYKQAFPGRVLQLTAFRGNLILAQKSQHNPLQKFFTFENDRIGLKPRDGKIESVMSRTFMLCDVQ